MEKGQYLKGPTSAFGSYGIFLFGGWDPLLDIFLVLTVIELITHISSDFVKKKLSSRQFALQLSRKLTIYGFVTISYLFDTLLGFENLLRNTTIVFYTINEFLSLTENAESIGVPVPKLLKEHMEKFKNDLMDKKDKDNK